MVFTLLLEAAIVSLASLQHQLALQVSALFLPLINARNPAGGRLRQIDEHLEVPSAYLGSAVGNR